MILNLKRYLSLLLVLMLLIGIVPTAYAAEPDTGSVVQEDTTEPTEPTAPSGDDFICPCGLARCWGLRGDVHCQHPEQHHAVRLCG